jgi:glycine cleavage system H protein
MRSPALVGRCGVVSYGGFAFPRWLRYSAWHAWVLEVGGGRVRVGVTDWAQGGLRAVVFVEPPLVGERVERGGVLALLESVEAVAEVRSPLTGTVVAYNAELDDDPGLINRDPYGRGWIAEIQPERGEELEELMTAEEYVERVLKREEKPKD